MRVFLTAHSARAGGGINVAQNIIHSLLESAADNYYYFTVPPGLGFEDLCEKFPRQETRVYQSLGLVRRWRWESTELVREMKAFSPDIILNLGNRGFISPGVPQVTLIHDAHLFYPTSDYGRSTFKERLLFRYHRAHLKRSLRTTQKVFCQTEVAKRRLIESFKLKSSPELLPNRLPVRWPDHGMEVNEPEQLRDYKDRYKLFVPTRYYAHKNLEIIPSLLERYGYAMKHILFVLTLSPAGSRKETDLIRRIESLPPQNRCLVVGHLNQRQLWAFYQHTDAMFLPSLLESFSAAYLEAMCSSRPILTSERDFAREICGCAAMYFDPMDGESIFRAICTLEASSALQSELINAGKERLVKMRMIWGDSGRTLIRALEQTASLNSLK